MSRPGWHSRGYLPHCDQYGLVQHVVFRLADSLPRCALEKTRLLDKRERYARCERLLDSGIGSAVLREPELAHVVLDSLMWFDGSHYALIAWCIMPNHVHVVVEPLDEHLLRDIVKSWKANSSSRINTLRGVSNKLWASEYFDRFMRSQAHLLTTIDYVENNPVAAGLCKRANEWAFSSASMRAPA